MHVAKQLLGIIIDNVVGRLPKGLFTDGKIIHMNAEIIEINQENFLKLKVKNKEEKGFYAFFFFIFLMDMDVV